MTVYQPEADMKALKAAARRRHQSQAGLIREGVLRVRAEEGDPILSAFRILDGGRVSAPEIDPVLAARLGEAGIER